MVRTPVPSERPALGGGGSGAPKTVAGRRLRRLAEELQENGLPSGDGTSRAALLEEVDRALRPAVHEHRAPSYGVVIDPAASPKDWEMGTELNISRMPAARGPGASPWRFADGLSSWLVRRSDGAGDEWLLFDRPAGSERDMVVLAESLEATIVQRHPSGAVRIVGDFGLLRWEGLSWHLEPPLRTWLGAVLSHPFQGDPLVLKALVAFAVHDLGARGIGALLVYRPDHQPGPRVEERLPVPPPLRVTTASHLAPLRHALLQVDGAAVFDAVGTLRQLGVRLVPSREAEKSVHALGGTRHTSGLRYSYDDPSATVVAISEDGPVSVLRRGSVLNPPGPPGVWAAGPGTAGPGTAGPGGAGPGGAGPGGAGLG